MNMSVVVNMRKHVTLSLEEDVIDESREIAGLIPFSRFVNDLLRKEVRRRKENRP